MEIIKLLNPSIIIKKNIFNSNVSIKNSDYYIASLMFLFYLAIFFVAVLFISFENITFENAYKLVFLTLNNTNPKNYFSNNIDFYDLDYFSHVVIIFLLFMSKVYFVSFLVIIKKILWR